MRLNPVLAKLIVTSLDMVYTHVASGTKPPTKGLEVGMTDVALDRGSSFSYEKTGQSL